MAADTPTQAFSGYDPPEPNAWDKFQDFGHSHWRNSLIWGIGLENVSILGPGLIEGKGLTRRSPRFAGIMQDLFAGRQPYLGLKKRLMQNLNPSLYEIAMSLGFSRIVPGTRGA